MELQASIIKKCTIEQCARLFVHVNHLNIMAGFKKFTAQVVSKQDNIIAIRHEEKMQVRPIDNNGYTVEIKTKDNKVLLLHSEVKTLIEYLIRISM